MRPRMRLPVCAVGVLVWLVGWLGMASSFAAVSSREHGEVVLQAETLEYARRQNRIVASGSVVLVYEQTRLFADRVELNPETGVGVAWGRVRLLTPEDDIRASRLEFELSTGRGILYDAIGVVARSYQVAARQIERRAPHSVTLREGQITTCTNALPDWAFRTREARLGEGGYVRLKHPSFWIKGIPVVYLPYFVLPLQDERTTGLLPPHVGGSRRDGAIVGSEFFWAMADWMDATLGLEYLSEKGWRPGVEFRYAIDPLSDGEVRGSFIHEQDTGKDRWKVVVQQRQEFGRGLRGLGRLDLRSKRDLDREFSRDIALESVVQTDSGGDLTQRLPNSTLSLAGASHQAIRDSGSTAEFRRLPSLRFTYFPTSIADFAFFAVEASYTRLRDTGVVDDTPVQRLDIFPNLSLPVALAPWLQLTASGGVRETFYDRRVSGGAAISRRLFDLRAHLQGPLLRRRYGGKTKGKAWFIHLIEPRVAYRYVPRVRQDEIPPFETLDAAQHFLDPFENQALVDRVAAVSYVKVAVLSRLFMQPGDGLKSTGIREMMRVVLSQGLDLRESAASGGRLLGPLDIELEMRFWQRWWMTASVRLAPGRGDLQESNWRLQVALRPGWVVHVANRYRRAPDILYVSGGLQIALHEGFQVGYTWRYDGQFQRFREHQATLSYVAQCWRLDMRFRWRQRGDTTVALRFNLWHF